MFVVVAAAVWTVVSVAAGISIAGANPAFAAKWDNYRRKIFGG
jgi:hypothetical protein